MWYQLEARPPFPRDGWQKVFDDVLLSGAAGRPVVEVPAPDEVDDGGEAAAADAGQIHRQVEVIGLQEEPHHVAQYSHEPGK